MYRAGRRGASQTGVAVAATGARGRRGQPEAVVRIYNTTTYVILPVMIDIKFQYIPGLVELNFQEIFDAVYHASLAINMLKNLFWRFRWSI